MRASWGHIKVIPGVLTFVLVPGPLLEMFETGKFKSAMFARIYALSAVYTKQISTLPKRLKGHGAYTHAGFFPAAGN